MNTFNYDRIAVVGTTSSGKSTLAQDLARKCGLDFIELDQLHWEPNWKSAELQVFQERARQATASQKWVCAGNYSQVRALIWEQAQAIIWLDYSLGILFVRLLRRTLRRGITGEELWNGNRETFWPHLKVWSDDSLFFWLFKTYWRRKREYPALFALPHNAHLKIYHFRHPRQTKAWLEDLVCDSHDMPSP